MRKRNLLGAIPAFIAAILIGGVGPAFGASPHFINASASGPANNGNLTVSWKEAGLGDNVLINYRASADATATWACINGGNHNPSAANKQTDTGVVSATGTFSSGKNGSINGSLTLQPPQPTNGFSCPNGQKLELAFVSYSDVSVTDNTNTLVADISGTFSRTFIQL